MTYSEAMRLVTWGILWWRLSWWLVGLGMILVLAAATRRGKG